MVLCLKYTSTINNILSLYSPGVINMSAMVISLVFLILKLFQINPIILEWGDREQHIVGSHLFSSHNPTIQYIKLYLTK